jgi:hypothetical protein
MSLKHRILSKISASYRIKNGWGLSPIRNNRELKALIWFCENELKDKEHMRLNPGRKLVYKNTIKLAKGEHVKKYRTQSHYTLYEYIDEKVDWYWN